MLSAVSARHRRTHSDEIFRFMFPFAFGSGESIPFD